MIFKENKAFAADRSGNVAILFALLAFVVLSAAGGALDFMRVNRERTAMQEAADSAALAAARIHRKPQSERDEVATRTFEQNYGPPPADKTFDFDISYEGDSVTVAATRSVPTALLKVIGVSALRANAISEAKPAASAPICLLALDESLPNGFEVYGNATLTAKNCAGVSNSSNDSGMRTYGGAVATAQEFAVVGDYEGEFTPTPHNDIAPVLDPFADMRLPETGNCIDASERLKQSAFTLGPGTYCGGLEIMAGASVRLNPGLYIMQGGPLVIQSGAEVAGEGVTIAFTGKKATLEMQGGGKLELTAPTEGQFAGIALFSESTSPDIEWMTISGGSTLNMVGTMYLPTHEIWIKSPTKDKATLFAETTTYGLIAKRFWVQGNSTLEVSHSDPNTENVLRLKNGVRLVR